MVSSNYYSIIKFIKSAFLGHPLVNNFYLSRYAIDSKGDIEYPAIICTTNYVNVGRTTNGSNIASASLTILYADRQTPECDNILNIQSTGMTVITEVVNAIINRLSSYDVTTNMQFQFFKNGFSDDDAGCFCDVIIEYPTEIGECYYVDEIDINCCF